MTTRHLFRFAVCGLMATLSVGCMQPPQRIPKTPVAAPFVPPTRTSAVDEALAELQAQSKSSNPSVRAQCIEAVQFLKDTRAIDMIRVGMKDKEWVVRFAAAMAAGRRQASELKYELKQGLMDEKEAAARVGFIYALQELGDSAYMPELSGDLQSSSPVVRANTAMVLGYIGDVSAIPMLHAAGGDKDPRVRFELTAALARLGDPGATSVIIAMSMSRYVDEHLLALAVCPDIKRVEVANILFTGLRDPLPEGQLLSARGLGKLGSVAGKDIALKHMTDENPDRRALAAMAWGDIFRPELEAPLVRMMQTDPDTRVRLAAACGLIGMWVRAETPPAAPVAPAK